MRTVTLTEGEAKQLLVLVRQVRMGGYYRHSKVQLAALESIGEKVQDAKEVTDGIRLL